MTQNAPGIHRYLDRVFAGVELTPEVQDLKEEVRADLLARVAELTAAGRSLESAVDTAIAEVGDLGEVVAEVAGSPELASQRPTSGAAHPAVRHQLDRQAGHPASWAAYQQVAALHRVRPRAWFVVGVVVLAAMLATAVTLVVLAALDVVTMSTGAAVLKAVAGALVGGGIVTTSLLQETTTHYPMPLGRAGAWGGAAAAGVLALGLGTLFAGDTARIGLLEAAILLAVACVAALVGLGVSQTNRTKAWVRTAPAQPLDRFSQDPAAAARFGIYAAVLWLLALVAVVVVGFTAGWLWSWTPLFAAIVLHLVLVARMDFPARAHG